MYHTLFLFKKISRYEYNKITKSLIELTKKYHTKMYPGDTCNDMVYELLSNSGITIIMKEKNLENDKYYCEIGIKFNPKRLLVEKEFIEVTTEMDTDMIVKKFKKCLNELNGKVKSYDNYGSVFKINDLRKYNVKRIDYCINVFSDNSEEIMDLIRRGDVPKKFKPGLNYDYTKNRKVMREGSFYLKSKSVIVNIYNKHFQLSNDQYFKDIDCTKAKGIIRLEVQCCNTKINNIKRLSGFEGKTIFNLAKNQIAKDILLHYLEKVIGKENYYTLKEARMIINECTKYSSKTKKEIIKTLELINEKKSVYKAREAYNNDLKFNKLIKNIRALDINPVTIPVGWKINILQNPVREIVKK